MFVFKYWNDTQLVTFRIDEDFNTTYVAINMTDEEVQALVDQKANEGALVSGWESEWVE